MDAQEIFDKVVGHLRKQGCKSLLPNPDPRALSRCAYRGEDGTKCAVGCLISDEDYRPDMEGKNAGYLCDSYRAMRHLADHEELLCDLQIVHDALSFGAWETEFELVARRHGLVYTRPS